MNLMKTHYVRFGLLFVLAFAGCSSSTQDDDSEQPSGDATGAAPRSGAVAQEYFEAIQKGDTATLGRLIDESIVWHQPGSNRFSGEHKGRGAVFEMLGAMTQLSNSTFAIDKVYSTMENGEMAACSIHFTGQRDSKSMSMDGVDVLRIKNGTIVEAWLFSSDQAAEDDFWGQ